MVTSIANINKALTAAKQLDAYYAIDHTIIDLPHWKSIAKQLTTISTKLLEREAALKQLPDGRKKSKLLSEISRQKNQIARYTPLYFDALLDALEHSIKACDPSTEIMDALRSDPWAIAYFELHQNKKALFSNLYQQGIQQIAANIANHNRQLLINIPRSEILEPKSSKCPNYLKFTDYFNQLSHFVQSEIVEPKSIVKRTTIVERWAAITQACFKEGDFSSMLAIDQGIKSSSIFRMQATNKGLSPRTKRILENNDRFLKDRANNEFTKSEQEKRNDTVIPYLGVYRTVLERIKSNLKPDENLADIKAAQAVADKVASIQSANKTKLKPEKKTLLQQNIEKITCNDALGKTIYEKSVQREPRDEVITSTNLFNKDMHSRLSLLKNPQLVSIFLERKILPTEVQIKSLAQVNNKRVGHRKFAKRLKKAGIKLNRKQIKAINKENRQIYYRSLITNKTLAKLSEKFTIQSKRFYRSTEKLISSTNKACLDPHDTVKLKNCLYQANIQVSDQELEAMIEEAKISSLPTQEYLQSEIIQFQAATPLENNNNDGSASAKTLASTANTASATQQGAWQYVKHHPVKTLTGAAIGGILCAGFFPHAIGSIVLYKLGLSTASWLGIKLSIGAAAGATATSTVGTSASSKTWWSRLFHPYQKTQVKAQDEHQTEATANHSLNP